MRIRIPYIIAAFLFIIIIFSLKFHFDTVPPEKMLEELFTSSGAVAVSSEIYFTGRLEADKFGNSDELKRLVLEIAEALGKTDGDVLCKTVDNDDITGIELESAVNGYENISINAVTGKQGTNGEYDYITVSVEDSREKPGLSDIRKDVETIFYENGIEPSVNSCITGNFAGKLCERDIEEICGGILDGADARQVEGMKDSGLTSISAYSPEIGRSISLEGKNINLNVALRYNSYEDKTYIWLATPLITTEY